MESRSAKRSRIPRTSGASTHSGADWSLGPRVYDGFAHDVVVGADGNVYYGGRAGPDHRDRQKVWAGALLGFDIKTQQLRYYPKPKEIGALQNGRMSDSTGIAWSTQINGLARTDPETGKWTEVKQFTPNGRPYDIAVDRLDQVWYAQIGIDTLGYVNARTGEAGEVKLTPRDFPDMLPKDREIGQMAGGGWNMITPLYGQGPRKMGAHYGDYLWVGMYWGGGLAKIDIRTKKLIKIYPVPGPDGVNGEFSNPYKIVVDKNNIVWVGMSNLDMLGRFDPEKEEWTFYPLATRGVDARHLDVDNSTNPPSVWVPYMGSQRATRVQFRDGAQ